MAFSPSDPYPSDSDETVYAKPKESVYPPTSSDAPKSAPNDSVYPPTSGDAYSSPNNGAYPPPYPQGGTPYPPPYPQGQGAYPPPPYPQGQGAYPPPPYPQGQGAYPPPPYPQGQGAYPPPGGPQAGYPPYPGQGYQQQGMYPPPGPSPYGQMKNSRATRSLVYGIIAFVISGISLFSSYGAFIGASGVFAIIYGIQGLNIAKRYPGIGGKGKSIAGIVLGAIGIFFILLILMFN
ncbi:DUF4190 domain-containing protein [Ktedonobacteria bacterium brp13]|nr:DUF4190 domain-containing protein [Ktedonobacteria bacterium brp13]